MGLTKKIFLITSRVFVTLVLGMVAATILTASRINLDSLRGDLVDILQESTGLPVEIDGKISWKLSLRPRVELNDVRVPNAAWAHHPNGFVARRIDVRLNLISLFQDRPTIQYVKIYDAAIFLERNAQGAYSITPQRSAIVEDAADAPDAGDRPIFPFKDPGLGAIEVRHLTAHILDDTYIVPGFQIGYNATQSNREYSGWIKSDKNVFPFIISYAAYNPERKVYPVRAAVSTGGDALIVHAALEGKSLAPIDFKITGQIPDLAAMAAVLNLDIMDIPSVRVNMAGGYDWHKLTLRKSTLEMRGHTLTLSGVWNWSGRRPKITAKVSSPRISLIELFPGLYGNGRWRRPNRPLNVFHDIPLYGQVFRGWDLDLDLEIGDLIMYRDLTLSHLDLDLHLQNAVARVDATATMADGDLRIGADVDIDTGGVLDVRAAGLAERVYIGDILKQIQIRDFISELPVNLEFYLQGRGATLSELMQTATGPAYMYSVAPGYAHSRLVSVMYGTDFLTSLRHTITDLFRSEKKHDQIQISCAAVNVKVRDGRIETERGVAVETNAINIQLAGHLDLGGENMRLSLATVPVRGLKLSLTGNVVDAVEISGNLAEPDVKINGVAVAGRVASATGLGLLLAPLTGGIGLVAGAGVGWLAGDLIENWLADDHPCETAMKKGAPSRRNDPAWMAQPMADLVYPVLKNTKK
ncbi:AsmA family protein [bacterium]|nr:AsmA family protein [bacterium]